MSPVTTAAMLATAAVWLWWPHPAARPRLWAGGDGDERIKETNLRLSPRPRLACAALASAGPAVLVPGITGLVLAAVAAGVVWWLSGRIEPPAVVRARARLAAELPEALALLASALSAGSPPRVAIDEVARVSRPDTAAALALVASHLRIGRGEDEAWLALAGDPLRAPVWGRAAKDLARNATSGAAVVDLLGVHATEARAERRARVEKQARTVGVRSVLPLMTCFLPSFILVGVVPIIAGLVGNFIP